MNGKNIILIGMPAVGKSTVGVILAKLLGYSFVDTDLVIQKSEGKLLKQIIAEKGIDGFIETENRILSSLDCVNSVISTGGSVVYGKEAMEHYKEIGTIVYLKVSLETLKRRLHHAKQRGVVMKEGQSLVSLYNERCSLYEKYADITIDEKNNMVKK